MITKILPPALQANKDFLSNKARTEVRNLVGAKPTAFLLQALGAWVVIIIMITLAIHINQIWISILAIIIIATRLNILGLLVHEQAHYLGFRGRYGDLIVNLLAAFPIGITIAEYTQIHLSHHQYFFTEKDPDHIRKSGKDWSFPMSKVRITKILLSDLLGLSFIKLLRGMHLKEPPTIKRHHPAPEWLRPTFYMSIAILLTYTESWQIFLLYWALPFFTVFPLIVRLGAITEHVYNLPEASVIDSSPLILLRWWEKVLLPNLNFTFHPYHHFYPGIAFCNLPKVHNIFLREKLVNKENIYHGYLAYLRYLQSTQKVS
ncbi:MAG: fatty acid desaturase [Methylophagaceae bacterium]